MDGYSRIVREAIEVQAYLSLASVFSLYHFSRNTIINNYC